MNFSKITIQTHDNHKLTAGDISALAESIATWLTSDGRDYASVGAVLSKENNSSDINALIAQFDAANWQSV